MPAVVTKSHASPNHNEYCAGRREALKALVREAKKVPCTDCGQRYPHYVMDLDHVRGEKKAAVSRLVSSGTYSMDTVLTEIAKCDVVCANCHRLRHYAEYRDTI